MKKRMFGTLLAFCLSVVLIGLVFCDTAKACPRDGCDGETYDYGYLDALRHSKDCSNCGYFQSQSHVSSKSATCTSPAYCDLCKCYFGEALGHHFVADAPVAPTCSKTGLTAGTHCDRCGLIGTAQEIVEKTAHTYDKGVVTKPSCNGEGYTTYTCKDCGYKFVTDKVKPLSHWYDEWKPAGKGMNSAPCKREGCEHTRTTACVDWSFKLKTADAEEAVEYTVCPVCGALSDGGCLELVKDAKPTPVTGWTPKGDMVLRCGELENGEKLMSVGFEYDARLTQCTGLTRFTVPAEVLEGCKLMLLDKDGGETELELVTENGETTFELDFSAPSGVARVPVRILHLVPTEA